MFRSVVVALAVALLAGCSSDAPAPRTLPPVTTTPPASPDPAPEAPALPPEATVGDSAGAGAFARHYFDVLNAALGSGQTTTLSELSDVDCEACVRYVESISSEQAQGNALEGGRHLVSQAIAPAVADGTTLVTIGFDLEAFQVRDATGALVREGPSQPGLVADVLLEYASGQWSVLAIDLS